jgi:hypothetical protein
MSGETRKRKQNPLGEGIVTALAVGGFFIILGLAIALTPGITDKANSFFNDLQNTAYPVGNTASTINLPAPAHPASHDSFYTAVMSFALGIGVLQIVILALRIVIHSPMRRIAETVGNMIFWLGAALLVSILLIGGTLSGWFQFWSALIILVGVSLIARFLILFAKR